MEAVRPKGSLSGAFIIVGEVIEHFVRAAPAGYLRSGSRSYHTAHITIGGRIHIGGKGRDGVLSTVQKPFSTSLSYSSVLKSTGPDAVSSILYSGSNAPVFIELGAACIKGRYAVVFRSAAGQYNAENSGSCQDAEKPFHFHFLLFRCEAVASFHRRISDAFTGYDAETRGNVSKLFQIYKILLINY